MNNLDAFSNLLFAIFITIAIISLFIFIGIIVRNKIKKKNLKVPILVLISTTVIFLILAGGIKISEYEKDKWFYSFKTEVIKQHDGIVNIELSPSRGGLSLFLICDEKFDVEKSKSVVTTIKHYLFDNSSGSNPSQQSFVKRGQREYISIYISFYLGDSENCIVSYEAGYYETGLQEKVDNFTTWHVDKGGDYSKFIIEDIKKNF